MFEGSPNRASENLIKLSKEAADLARAYRARSDEEHAATDERDVDVSPRDLKPTVSKDALAAARIPEEASRKRAEERAKEPIHDALPAIENFAKVMEEVFKKFNRP